MLNKWRGLARVGFLLLCLLIVGRSLTSYLWSNIGLIFLSHYAHSEFDPELGLNYARDSFHRSLKLSPSNSAARRGIGFVHWYFGNDLQALENWDGVGFGVRDYLLFGQHADGIAESLRWYNLAEKVTSDNPELWLRIGQICQRNPSVGEVCDRFLTHNDFNWLVDSDFAFDRDAWHFNRREGAEYVITECPGVPDKKCAMVEIYEVTFPYGTGWHQCLTLEPGQRYSFSAWVKVETEGEWIPIYYQGGRDGDPHGVKLGGSHTGAQDWTYFEQEFAAPEYDGDRACFHPARLLDVGQLWFYSATLRMVE